jgi:predicted amidohydrolase YtcJ
MAPSRPFAGSRIAPLAAVLFTLVLAACGASESPQPAAGEEAPTAAAEAPEAVPAKLAVEPASFVFGNGRIYTVNEAQPWAEAVAVKGNEIVYVGDTETAKGYIGEGTEFVELGGKMMLPGFVESHFHTTIGAAFGQGLWLAHLDSKEETLAAVKKYVDANPGAPLIMGFGWKSYAFPPEGPSKDDLDAITTEKPIFLFEISAHAAWVNSKALEMAGVTKDTEDPQPGFSYFKRDAKGDATGWIIEAAAEFSVLNKIQPITPEYVRQGLELWMPKFSASGITTAVDQGYIFQGPAEAQIVGYKVLTDAEKAGKLTMRVYPSYYVNNPEIDNLQGYRTLKAASPDTRLVKHRVLKINHDGDVASHSVKLYEPFIDNGEYGTTIFEQDDLTKLVTDAAGDNIHVHFHAMGDASVGDVLTAIEAARKAHPDSTSRYSLAHVYLINPRDFERVKAVDLIPAFSGGWLAPDPADMDAKDRLLGDKRLDAWYPFKSLDDLDVRCAFGSDFPAAGAISTYKMLEQIQYAMTRQFLSGKGEIWPPEGERIALEAALGAATLNGAYTVGIEDEIGSIEVGKLADLIVLDQNLFDIDVSKIHDTQVLLTMVDGKVVHDAFFGLGDVTEGLKVLGLVAEESEDFDLLVSDLLKYKPANTDYDEHKSACNIGTAMYEVLKATRSKDK